MASIKINEALFDKLAEILEKHQLGEVEYQDGAFRIRVASKNCRSGPDDGVVSIAKGASPIHQPSNTPAEDWETRQGAMKSPMVGVCYLSPEPGAPHFVEVGDIVKEGQPILIIEAMKVMNLIKAQKSGKIVHIAVKNGDPIEYGQLLVVID
ncbi:MAG: biotin/lipoyl-binding protein [Holosporales bacterium]|jgi:acetyl-CoA carboxylase biotin carboxyl carrier protein|nr:biotin/lipoyl-binding protein [Holosporales bacterium]